MTADEILSAKPIPPMVEGIFQRLEEMIPLFKGFEPKGWKDFRDKELSKGWRGGLFFKMDADDGRLVFKGVFGSRALACLAASQFYHATSMGAFVDQSSGQVWSVVVDISFDQVNW